MKQLSFLLLISLLFLTCQKSSQKTEQVDLKESVDVKEAYVKPSERIRYKSIDSLVKKKKKPRQRPFLVENIEIPLPKSQHLENNYFSHHLERFNRLGLLQAQSENSSFMIKDSAHIYTKNVTFNHSKFFIPNMPFNDYMIKETVQNISTTYQEGNGFNKIDVEIFPIESSHSGIDSIPKFSMTAYADNLKIRREGFLTSKYGCCLSPDNFQLFTHSGELLIESSNLITAVYINENDNIRDELDMKKIYFGIIQDESEEEHPSKILIRHPNNTQQEIILEGLDTDFYYGFCYNIYNKNEKGKYISETSSDNNLFIKEYRSVDDITIVVPVNKKDTLRIPFKNGKPFGNGNKRIIITPTQLTNNQ